ncbi:MAG: fluoride efflux transporter CrcB [Prevotella sp.]|nr:fluoride efflux transporter CrcB [Candidatus Prevotella equi]
MKELLYIFVGGGIGSVFRYIVSMIWKHITLHPDYQDILFPWPTFLVNVLGCFIIGLFYHCSERWGLSPEMRLLLTTGLCGGFTTFSTFSYEGISLLTSGHYIVYGVYLFLSILFGLLAVLTPIYLIR